MEYSKISMLYYLKETLTNVVLPEAWLEWYLNDAPWIGLFIYGLWSPNSIGRHILNPTQSINSALCSWVVSSHFPSPCRQRSAQHHTRITMACSSASVCLSGAPQVELQLCPSSASSVCTSAAKRRSEQSEVAQSAPITSSRPFAQTSTCSTIANIIRISGRSNSPLMMLERRPSSRNSCLWRGLCTYFPERRRFRWYSWSMRPLSVWSLGRCYGTLKTSRGRCTRLLWRASRTLGTTWRRCRADKGRISTRLSSRTSCSGLW